MKLSTVQLVKWVLKLWRKPYEEVFTGFVYQHEPIPAPRVTRNSLWRAKNYADYKSDLAALMKLNYPDAVLQVPTDPKEIKGWKKMVKRYRYFLAVEVFTTNDNADGDNFLKTAADAIAKAGLVYNDKQIKSWVIDVWNIDPKVSDELPRIEISLYRR